ncbi:hypothetical protein AS9A_P20120 (plasmid) [Hoyosella subflava DQS3-9A1]|uniref:Uncharacterized protein n=1 Tax=Hoyosella subflava (strain DSM 45089 / JCM 17490 / NBRC 109087 / DQS3-9A1) TaxID=443218 RepID=F6ESP3_HOYSD|nr:hypothetical protein AS9A_P20120 [Hoyosella subflava DQS3-9A1]
MQVAGRWHLRQNLAPTPKTHFPLFIVKGRNEITECSSDPNSASAVRSA